MNWQDTLISSAGQLGSAAMNQVFANINAKRDWKYTQKQMALQQQYAKENFALQNQRQDYLMRNQASIQKQALAQAGYSTADPNGTGVTTAAVGQIDSPSGGQFRTEVPQQGYFPTYSDLLQSKLIQSQVDVNEAEKRKKDQETREKEINNFINENYGEDIAKANLNKLQKETQKLVSETLYVDAKRLNEFNLTSAEIADINKRLEMDIEKQPLQMKLLAAQIVTESTQQKLNKAQAAQAYANVKLLGEQINKIKTECKLNDKQLEVLAAQIQNLRAEGLLIKHKDNYQIEQNAMKRLERQVQEDLGVEWHMAKDIISTLVPLGFIGAAMSHVSGNSTPSTSVRKYERVGSADIPIFDFGR